VRSGELTGQVEQYVHDGLTFDVDDKGPVDGRAVIMLHGFPEDRQGWAALAQPLVSAGYRVLAPEQRGYSSGAQPAGRKAYTLDQLTGDILALADAAGVDRFDVVGHDWGAAVAWELAGRHPERVQTLCALSVPHPRAMQYALWHSAQVARSWYMALFQIPALPERLLAWRQGQQLTASLVRSGLDQETAERYASRASRPDAMTGPLNWYRALPLDARRPLGPVSVPTLFVWGDKERFVNLVAARACATWVTGPYRFVPLAGHTHWLPTTAAGEIAPLLLEHLAESAA
jgi:pimeloyl-ACP methyl ester carboxylesterase